MCMLVMWGAVCAPSLPYCSSVIEIPTLHTVFTSKLICERVDIVLSAGVCKVTNELQEKDHQHVSIQPSVE